MFLDVWAELIAGLIIAGLALFGRYLWAKVFWPFVEEMAYREVKIEGRYKVEMTDIAQKDNSRKPDRHNIELFRKAHVVTGEMIDQ